MKNIFVGLVFLGMSVTGYALPIPNNITAAAKAGWFPSASKPCPNICKEKGLVAEEETYTVPSMPNRKTYSCKAAVVAVTNAAQRGMIFGNNFDSSNFAPFCIATDIFGKTNRYAKFMCLCVRLVP